jgi:DNA polymerase-3 subunit delta'
MVDGRVESAAGERFLGGVEGFDDAKRCFQRARGRHRLGHAYLFVGPEDSGKGRFARELAMALLCQSGEPCRVCPSCRQAAAGSHPHLDVHGADRDRAPLDIREVRELAGKDHRRHLGPSISIVENCERLAPAAANALLKTLEEPSPGAVLLLLAPSTAALLPTLVSRCQRLLFPALPDRGGEDGAGGDAGRWRAALEDARAADFFARSEPREWLEGLGVGEGGVRVVLGGLIDGLIRDRRREWRAAVRAGAPRASDLTRQIEMLLALKRDLDGNVNADLLLEAALRLIRAA